MNLQLLFQQLNIINIVYSQLGTHYNYISNMVFSLVCRDDSIKNYIILCSIDLQLTLSVD